MVTHCSWQMKRLLIFPMLVSFLIAPSWAQDEPRAALPKEMALNLGADVTMECVLVPAGEFQMGDAEGFDSDKPVHPVRITQPFYIGKYTVTVAQFRQFAKTTGYQTDAEKQGDGYTLADKKWKEVKGVNWRTPGFDQGDDYPVLLVSWNDAQEFAKWASNQSGKKIALPSEAQWEYAARGPQSLNYPWGNVWDGTKANHLDRTMKNSGLLSNDSAFSSDTDGYVCTSPVGHFQNASWCGAFDMSGNVFQWCQDTLDNKFYANSRRDDPINNEGLNGTRVLRGGAWIAASFMCRSAFRFFGFKPNLSSACNGFRVVVVTPSSKTP